jgi:uncharacterized membrane protein YagU involved in acid resistance
MSKLQNRDASVWKGIASGVVAGLAASYVMTQFQSGLKALLADSKESKSSNEGEAGGRKEPATVKAAEAISEGITDHELTISEKKVAGPAMHYGMGATSGAIYGIAAELQPAVTFGAGAPFGAAVWLLADEVAVPSLGLSDPPWKSPISTHVQALAAHFVYGLTTDALRRVVRSAL